MRRPCRACAGGPGVSLDRSLIKDVVAVHRLREVSCLYGFTRLEAALTSADGDLEDVHLAVRGAPISRGADWLRAIEQFGERIFIHFDAGAIRRWRARDATKTREEKLFAGYLHWRKRFSGKPAKYPGSACVLLHSLSRASMAEIALDCGYPPGSLKERVYALPGLTPGGSEDRCGITMRVSAWPGLRATTSKGTPAITASEAPVWRTSMAENMKRNLRFNLSRRSCTSSCKFRATDVGVQLMRAAFDETPAPSDPNEPDPERGALAHVFAGAIGFFKNPPSHRAATINARF